MRRKTVDAEFTLVYDGLEDPTVKTFSTTVDHNGNPLVATTYEMQVRARNIVGFGAFSESLELDIAMRTSHSLSIVSGDGIAQSFGAVTNSIHVQAYDEDGNPRTSGGDLFFLHVEQLCYVTDNYRCDLSVNQSNVATLPIVTQMTDNSDGTYYVEYSVP